MHCKKEKERKKDLNQHQNQIQQALRIKGFGLSKKQHLLNVNYHREYVIGIISTNYHLVPLYPQKQNSFTKRTARTIDFLRRLSINVYIPIIYVGINSTSAGTQTLNTGVLKAVSTKWPSRYLKRYTSVLACIIFVHTRLLVYAFAWSCGRAHTAHKHTPTLSEAARDKCNAGR